MNSEDRFVSNFPDRVRVALRQYVDFYRAQAADQKPKLSISSFTKISRLSRSLLYKEHRELIAEVEFAFRQIEREAAAAAPDIRKPSIASLTAENVQLKKRQRYELNDLGSRQYMKIMAEYGPMYRSRKHAVHEHQYLEERVREKDETIKRQKRIIDNLYIQLNSKTGPIGK